MVDWEAGKKDRKNQKMRDRFDIIQAVANIAVVIALLFTVSQYMTTIRPTQQEQSLIKAQALFNSGQFKETIERYDSFLLRDNPIALNNLGYINERGLDVRQDKEKAKYYYRKAAAAGSEMAVNNLIRLDVEDFSDESKDELVRIFRSAYEMKNDKLLKAALSIIRLDNSSYTEEDYRKLFANNAETFASLLVNKNKEIEGDGEGKGGGWFFVETFYTTTAGVAYTGSDSKLVYQGAISGANEEGQAGLYYKYSLYKRAGWHLDELELEFGMEKILIAR